MKLIDIFANFSYVVLAYLFICFIYFAYMGRKTNEPIKKFDKCLIFISYILLCMHATLSIAVLANLK